MEINGIEELTLQLVDDLFWLVYHNHTGYCYR